MNINNIKGFEKTKKFLGFQKTFFTKNIISKIVRRTTKFLGFQKTFLLKRDFV